MNEDVGRSLRDGLSQAEPEVSAVPASIPSAWPEVEWGDGYPLAEDDDFAAWDSFPLSFKVAADFLLRELPKAAENCCASCEVIDAFNVDEAKPVKQIKFSTGGWSGAESLMGFIESRFDTRYFMLSWRRGGHYVFEIPVRFLAPRDSDGSPQGGDACGSVHDSAGPQGHRP